MTEAVWTRLVEQFVPAMRGVELCGLGEPTLAKLFPRAASDVVASGKQLYFPTNGYFLDKKHVLDSVGATPRVSVSLDAWDEESYRKVRGGDWNRVRDAVAVFRKEKPDAILHSQFTAGQYNIDGLPSFVQIAADWGIREVVMKPVQCHTIAREDNSLRYARARTEKAIEQAAAIASHEGVAFTAEQRPYADDQDDDDDDPLSRLKRYLDFQPFATGDSCGGFCLRVDMPVRLADGTDKPVGNLSKGDVLLSVNPHGNRVHEAVEAVLRVEDQRCYRVIVRDVVRDRENVVICTPDHPFWVPAGTRWTRLAAKNLREGDRLVGVLGDVRVESVTPERGLHPIVRLTMTGPHRVYFGAGVLAHNSKQSGGSLQGFSDGDAEIVTIPDIVQLPEPAAAAAKPVFFSDAALIVAANGDAWPCFSQRKIGNVLQDSLREIIENPRYQAFLQNRAIDPATEKWCHHCPRVY